MNFTIDSARGAENPAGFIPLSRSFKRNIRDAIVGLTMAVWCFLWAWMPLLDEKTRYSNKIPAIPAEFAALLANIFWLAALIWFGIGVWRNSRSRPLVSALDLLFLGLLLFPVDYIRAHVGLTGGWLGGLSNVVHSPITLAALLAFVAFVFWRPRILARGVAMIVCVTFPAALWTIVKLALLTVNLMHMPTCDAEPLTPPPLLPAQKDGLRVLWIIFDETDYRLTFEKRPPGLDLPEFDRLRRESLFADHAYSPADRTMISMPALITGHRLSAAQPVDCDLELTLAEGDVTSNWSRMPSVFSDARQLGFNTALVGWYHPYERMLGENLNYCSWYAFPDLDLGRASTFGLAMKEQILAMGGNLDGRRIFINVCKDSLKDSLSVVTNPAYGLTLLHLPPPHMPGVYLPAEDKFTVLGIAPPSGYFDNLVLANNELGKLRRAMEAGGQWDKTWVILSADHSWRRSKLYDGIRDYRVPFLVKNPGPGRFMFYSHQFNTTMTHDLILAILRRQVTNQAGAAALLDTGKPSMPIGPLGPNEGWSN